MSEKKVNGTTQTGAEGMTLDGKVRGEPELNVEQVFEGRRLLVVGGTGFLGKVWLSMLLDRYPNIGHIYLIVRPKAGMDSEQRFWTEVVPSPVFDPLRERYDTSVTAFLASRISPIPGDVSYENLGIPPKILEEMHGKIDAIVNASGLVDFDPPIDKAIKANAFGIRNIVGLAKELGDAPIFHTSTCYVAGTRAGIIEEIDPREFPFPRAEELERDHWSPEQEVSECVDIVEMAKHRANDQFRQSAFLDEAKRNLEKKGEPTRGPALEDELKKVKRRFVENQLSGFGTERAKYWGWPNTYTYTKSIGEQILLSSGLRVAIGRPAIIETSLEYPFPGWNEGINTSAPLIYLAMKGHIQFPAGEDQNLDFIPVDTVSAGMIGSLAALLQNTHRPVYQYACSDVNPCTVPRFVDLLGIAKWRRFKKGGTLLDLIQARLQPVIIDAPTFHRQGAGAIGRYAKGIAGLLRKGAIGPLAGPVKGVAKAVDGYAKIASLNGEIFELFIPFTHDTNYTFRCDNTRSLFERMPEADRDRLPWRPETIDWRDWFLNVHVPGLERWTEPLLDEKLAPKRKPLRRHENLWELVDEMGQRHEHMVALQRLEGEQLWRISFAQMRDLALQVAAELAERGVQPGDRVLLSGRNHPMWPISYFGILRAGAVAVPVDPELESPAFANIVRSSEAALAILDDDALENAGVAVDGLTVLPLVSVGADRAAQDAPEVDIAPDAMASLIFTSGTTGNPKGVMLSHENFTAMVSSLAPLFPLGPKDSALSVLPLHHTFEFTCGMLLPLSRGARITYLDELNGERLTAGLKKGKVSALVGVPALWQLLERRITAEVSDKGKVAKLIFDFGLSMNRSLGKKVGLDAGRMLFGTVHSALGGRLKYLVSGGAALPEDTQQLFQGLGLHLAEGYGLTEAAPVLTVAKGSPKAKPGHVGEAVPGVEIKLDEVDDNGVGEVLAKGPNVMKGYAGQLDATKAVITEDGWLRTGDLGKIDHKGKLHIVGRAKEVIVAANGENVYPDDVEALLGTPEHVRELSILGLPDARGGERVACIAAPEEAEEGESHALRLARAEDSLRKAIKQLPRHMRPVEVQIYDADLPRTATRKVKRKECRAIMERLIAASVQTHEGEDDHVSLWVRHAVATVSGRQDTEIHDHTRLGADLGFDSLTLAELVAALDAAAKKRGQGAVDGERVMQCETVAQVAEVVGRGGRGKALERESATRTIHDVDDSVPTELPETVQDYTKRWARGVQMGFYDRVMHTKVYGRAHIPQNRNTIVVSNHCSHLDLGAIKYALGSYGKDIATLGAKDYFFDTWRGHYFRNFTNVEPIDRQLGGQESLNGARRVVRQGKLLLLFPEGTRSKSGVLQDFKPGVGYLTLETGVDILPVFVDGTHDIMPKGQSLPSGRRIRVRIGEPLDAGLMRERTAGMRPDEAARAAAKAAQLAVAALRDGKRFELSEYDAKAAVSGVPEQHPMTALFEYLESQFVPGETPDPVRFYFSLGDEQDYKWTVEVNDEGCKVRKGKPDGGVADCVLKTSANMMERIVREKYIPSPAEFMSGAIKTNDPELLGTFQRVFALLPQ